MKATTRGTVRTHSRSRYAAKVAAGLGIAVALWSAPIAPIADASQIVPSIGLTRAADSDETKSNLGLALRGNLAGPMVQAELGVSYRREEYFDGGLAVKTIPVTASLLVRPVPTLHADVGAGWYHAKYEYADALLLSDETKQLFGVHLGGGLQIPMAPRAALDLTGRYVLMRDQESKLVPEKFNPDFWTMSLGLAIKF